MVAKFDHWKQNTFTAPFEVKKYGTHLRMSPQLLIAVAAGAHICLVFLISVLPAFNVTLTPRKSFFSLHDNKLEVEVSARYLFGEPVQGTAYVVFGIKINQEMIRLPSVKKVTDVSASVLRGCFPCFRSV